MSIFFPIPLVVFTDIVIKLIKTQKFCVGNCCHYKLAATFAAIYYVNKGCLLEAIAIQFYLAVELCRVQP